MSVRALGRELLPVQIADGVPVSLKNASSVLFSCYLAAAAGDTYTLSASATQGGSYTPIACITQYYTGNGIGGVLTQQTQAAASTVVTTATTAQNGMFVEVEASSIERFLPGAKYVKLTSTGAGLVHAILTNLTVQRRPSNLASPVV